MMKKSIVLRLIAVLLVAVVSIGALSSCSLILGGLVNQINAENVTVVVRGNLDVLYHGVINDDYLELSENSEQELQTFFEEGIVTSADYLAYYWGIIGEDETLDQLDDALYERLINLMKQITLKTKYEVALAEEQQDGSYVVNVVISPLDIMVKADEIYQDGSNAALSAILKEAEEINWEELTEAEYWAFSNRYGNIIADLLESLLPTAGYLENVTLPIRVDVVDDYLEINDDDFYTFDERVIPYN